MIRVLNRSKPIRALVKGHAQPVVDLRFFSDSLDLLASSGKDGSVFIWKIVSSSETVTYPNGLRVH
jgi:WD40 repeat protein